MRRSTRIDDPVSHLQLSIEALRQRLVREQERREKIVLQAGAFLAAYTNKLAAADVVAETIATTQAEIARHETALRALTAAQPVLPTAAPACAAEDGAESAERSE